MRRPPLALLFALAACQAGHDREETSAPGLRVYVTNEISGDLTIIDAQARRIVGRVALGEAPRGIVASPDGRLLYIALGGSSAGEASTRPTTQGTRDGVAVFEIASGRVRKVLRGISGPETLAISPDGTRLYVAGDDRGELVTLDTSSGRRVEVHAVGGEPEGVAVSPDGRLVYATSEADDSVAVIDTYQGRVRARILVGRTPRNAVFSASGELAFVPGEDDASVSAIAVAQDRVVRTARIEGDAIRPMDVRLTQNNAHLFVTTGRAGQLVRMNPGTLEITGRVEVGDRPWGLGISPDGRFAFTANGRSNDVAMVDTGSMRVVARFPTGTRPWGIVALPTY